MLDFQDGEQKEQRGKPQIRRSVKTWRRVYHIPEAALATLVPDKGDALDLRGETAGLGVNQHRVLDVHIGKRLDCGAMVVISVFYQVRARA